VHAGGDDRSPLPMQHNNQKAPEGAAIIAAPFRDFLVIMLHRSTKYVHRVSKNVPPLACYDFDTHEWILIFFGRNVTDKVGNQKMLYYATSNNLCFCTIW